MELIGGDQYPPLEKKVTSDIRTIVLVTTRATVYKPGSSLPITSCNKGASIVRVHRRTDCRHLPSQARHLWLQHGIAFADRPRGNFRLTSTLHSVHFTREHVIARSAPLAVMAWFNRRVATGRLLERCAWSSIQRFKPSPLLTAAMGVVLSWSKRHGRCTLTLGACTRRES